MGRAGEARWLDGLFLLVCGIALFHGIQATHDLRWPYDADLHRDMGRAASIARGDFFSDPQYLGEGQWYNPLVPSIVALAHCLSGLETNVLYCRLGAYLNLLGPIFFYLLLLRLFDRRVAIFGAIGFVFAIGRGFLTPFAATYTPWLYASCFSQALFYAALACLARAQRGGEWRWSLASGALLGLTFLGHTYPALVLGGVMLLTSAGRTASRRPRRPGPGRELARLLVALGVAFVVSLPYSWTLLFEHRLQVRNAAPIAFSFPAMESLSGYLALHLSWTTPVVLLGAFALLREWRRPEAQIAIAWVAIVTASVVYLCESEALRGLGIPAPVAFSMHACFYFSAVLALLFGLGARLGVEAATRLLAARRGAAARPPRPGAGALTLGLAAALVLAFLPGYGDREFFVLSRHWSEESARKQRARGVTEWIREHTAPDDVFLAADLPSLFSVIAAGRKIVATYDLHSNPYLDVEARRRDRDLLFEHIRRKEWEDFFALAERYRVSYILAVGPEIEAVPPEVFDKRFEQRGYAIFRVERRS